MEKKTCERKYCQKISCRTKQRAYIYGLYDVRLHDFFYVGYTLYLADRFSEHLHGDRSPDSYKSQWIKNILEMGSYPLPILLFDFMSDCDVYTHKIESEIAEQLRAQGYTAMCDFYFSPFAVTAYLESINLTIASQGSPIAENMKQEYIDLFSEQARVNLMLREMYTH